MPSIDVDDNDDDDSTCSCVDKLLVLSHSTTMVREEGGPRTYW